MFLLKSGSSIKGDPKSSPYLAIKKAGTSFWMFPPLLCLFLLPGLLLRIPAAAVAAGGEGGRHMEIQPKALAIELMRIIAAKNGHRMRIMALKIFLLRKGAPFSVTS